MNIDIFGAYSGSSITTTGQGEFGNIVTSGTLEVGAVDSPQSVTIAGDLSVSGNSTVAGTASFANNQVTINSKAGIEVGGFFQKAVEGTAPEGATPWNYEKEFYGAYFTYPVVSGYFVDLGFNVRTGVSNGENFVITPSILTSIAPIQQIKIGAGLGVRAMRPTVQGTITIRLNAGSKGGLLASK